MQVEVGNAIVDLRVRRENVVPDSEVECQAIAGLPIVLQKSGAFIVSQIIGLHQEAARASCRETQQERRDAVSAGVGCRIICEIVTEVQRTACVRVSEWGHLLMDPAETELGSVRSQSPRNGVAQLNIRLARTRREKRGPTA